VDSGHAWRTRWSSGDENYSREALSMQGPPIGAKGGKSEGERVEPVAPSDVEIVARFLGRQPSGDFSVVVRRSDGTPAVIENAPVLDDGRPMPTLFWLIEPKAREMVSKLESRGGVRMAEASVDVNELSCAHMRYRAQRDAKIPEGHSGPRPSGGVGGTRQGVKCLHAHLAWWLAGGDDPVGAWVAEEIGLDVSAYSRSQSSRTT
jgi:uncharacterized protein